MGGGDGEAATGLTQELSPDITSSPVLLPTEGDEEAGQQWGVGVGGGAAAQQTTLCPLYNSGELCAVQQVCGKTALPRRWVRRCWWWAGMTMTVSWTAWSCSTL